MGAPADERKSFDSTRWSVVLGAGDGDPLRREAFGRLYDPIVRAFLSARWRVPRDHESVEDAVQDVFVQCFRPGGVLERVDPDRTGGFRAYLYGVTSHVAADAERRRSRRRDRAPGGDGEQELDEVAEDDGSASRAFDLAWTSMVIEEAYELMLAHGDDQSQHRVAALQLKYRSALPPREIAERSGLPLRRVYHLLETGRSEFRTSLLHVLGKYHPGESEAELIARFEGLIEVLDD